MVQHLFRVQVCFASAQGQPARKNFIAGFFSAGSAAHELEMLRILAVVQKFSIATATYLCLGLFITIEIFWVEVCSHGV